MSLHREKCGIYDLQNTEIHNTKYTKFRGPFYIVKRYENHIFFPPINQNNKESKTIRL